MVPKLFQRSIVKDACSILPTENVKAPHMRGTCVSKRYLLLARAHTLVYASVREYRSVNNADSGVYMYRSDFWCIFKR